MFSQPTDILTGAAKYRISKSLLLEPPFSSCAEFKENPRPMMQLDLWACLTKPSGLRFYAIKLHLDLSALIIAVKCLEPAIKTWHDLLHNWDACLVSCLYSIYGYVNVTTCPRRSLK